MKGLFGNCIRLPIYVECDVASNSHATVENSGHATVENSGTTCFQSLLTSQNHKAIRHPVGKVVMNHLNNSPIQTDPCTLHQSVFRTAQLSTHTHRSLVQGHKSTIVHPICSYLCTILTPRKRTLV